MRIFINNVNAPLGRTLSGHLRRPKQADAADDDQPAGLNRILGTLADLDGPLGQEVGETDGQVGCDLGGQVGAKPKSCQRVLSKTKPKVE